MELLKSHGRMHSGDRISRLPWLMHIYVRACICVCIVFLELYSIQVHVARARIMSRARPEEPGRLIRYALQRYIPCGKT